MYAKQSLRIGLTFEVEATVTDNMLASYFQSGLLDVFATPSMIALMEQAALLCVEKYLEEGYTTVGTKVEVNHLASTPKGVAVKAKAELIEIDERRLTFKIEAYDSVEKIGEGIHERFIVNKDRFLTKTYQKAR